MCVNVIRSKSGIDCSNRCLTCKNKMTALLKDEVSFHLSNDNKQFADEKLTLQNNNNQGKNYKLKNVKEGNHF